MQMKHGIYGLVIGLAFSTVTLAAEAPKVGCAAKLDAISAELAQAKAAGNKYKVAGLEKAYDEVSTHCDDDSYWCPSGRSVYCFDRQFVCPKSH